LFRNGGKVNSANAGTPINDLMVMKTAREAAEKTVLVLRDEKNVLPLRPEQKVLLIEQVFPTHQMANNMSCHPGMLWEEMCLESDNVYSVEVPNVPGQNDRDRIMRRLSEADIIVTTNYYYHKVVATMTDLIREIQMSGKSVVVISNSPYEFTAPADFPTVICIFTAGSRENLRTAVKVLYGKLQPTARLSINFAAKSG
jgi:hypothetical protein